MDVFHEGQNTYKPPEGRELLPVAVGLDSEARSGGLKYCLDQYHPLRKHGHGRVCPRHTPEMGPINSRDEQPPAKQVIKICL